VGYAIVTRPNVNETSYATQLWRTTDGGAHWTAVRFTPAEEW